MSRAGGPAIEREFRLDDRHFGFFQRLARNEAGIELADAKRELVYGRLARRLRVLGLDGFDPYCELLAADGSPERIDFVNAITTNVTSFFREDHHFDFLRDEAYPALMEKRRSSRRLRIWSAACSTGQEPYSIAITTARSIPTEQDWDWRILATDIDRRAVAAAEAGVYPDHQVPELSAEGDRRRWFKPVSRHDESNLLVADALRQRIYFRVLNLMHPWPMDGPIDVIFCRNVVIYFSKETQRALFERFARILAPDGYLFIGHSESMLNSGDLFESVGRTIYRPSGSGR